VRMLETLARVRASDTVADFLGLAQGAASSSGLTVQTGTRIIAVTPPLPLERRGALHTLSRRGFAVEVFFVTSQDSRPGDAALPGIVTHAVDSMEGSGLHA
jgi:hypothetical protein